MHARIRHEAADSRFAAELPSTGRTGVTDLNSRVEMCLRCWRIDGGDGVEVRVLSGTVTLVGEVTSSAAKYRVAECCRHIPGVHEVVDALRVKRAR